MESYYDLDTHALIVDKAIMEENIARMAAKAQKWGVKLRPHTKSHRVPALAKLQIAAGASGITVAKVGEAEVMADNGLNDIFIANEIIGATKNNRLLAVHHKVLVAVGVDNQKQIESGAHWDSGNFDVIVRFLQAPQFTAGLYPRASKL